MKLTKRVRRGIAPLRRFLGGGTTDLDPASQTRDEFLAALHRGFAEDGVKSRRLSTQWWDDFFVAITSCDEDGGDVQDRMIHSISASIDPRISFGDLTQIYKMTLRYGLFRVGYGLRTKARGLAIDALCEGRLKGNSKDYLRALSALLEARDWDRFEEKLPLLNQKYRVQRGCLNSLYRLLRDGEDSGSLREVLIRSDEDLDFSKFVVGKRVAIVGPARTENCDGQEIDRFDLVVRCNYKEEGVGIDPEVKGLRCDVSYFNSAQARYVCSTDSPDGFPESVNWIVCKREADWKRFEQWIRPLREANGPPAGESTCRVRAARTFEFPLFSGTLNAVPNAVLDLLTLRASHIEVFHSDLMLTVDRAQNYDPDVRDTNDALAMAIKTFSGDHDPVTQYALLRAIYDARGISGDAKFVTAMELGEQLYMDELQMAYGKFGRSLRD